MHLDGEITEGSVDDGGTVRLTGPFVETDFSRRVGIVFYEDSRVTGIDPLIIEVSPGSNTFRFTWCELLAFNNNEYFPVEVSHGNLRVR